MAETLTYDPTPADAPELTPEEQDSLQVGEKMAAEEQQLLAGKFQSSEELEKAYVELQKKLGEKSNEDSEATGDTESDESEKDSEEKEETEENSEGVALINEASAEYYENDGSLSPETIEKFSSMSSQDLVKAYIEVQKNNPQAPQQETEIDVSESDINSIQNSVGGKSEYDNVVQWASGNLEESQIKAFDDLVSTGNVPAIKLAIAGLKSQYDNANGYEGRMLSGKSAKTAGDVFRSQAEVVQAMNDPRYEKDEAYRNDVFQKLERSNVNF